MPRPRPSRSTVVLVVGAAAYAALGLAISVAWFDLGDLDVDADFFAELGPAAQHLAAGEVNVANHPYKGPMQPALVAAAHALLGPLGVGWYRTAVVISMLGVLLALGATIQIGSSLANRRVAVAAAVLTAANPVVLVTAHKAGSDGLFLGLALACVATVLGPVELRRRHWLLAGLLAGGAFLTRYAGAVLPAWLVLVAVLRPATGPRNHRWADAGLTLAGFLVASLPWFAVNLAQSGVLLDTRNAENVAREFGGRSVSSSLLGHYLANLPRRLHEVATSVLGWPTTALAWLGLAVVLFGRVGWRRLALLGFAALVLASLASVFFLPRFALPLVPVAAVLAASALLGDGGLSRRLKWRGGLAAWVVVGLLVGSLVPASVLAVRFHREQQPSHLQASITFLRGVAQAEPAPRLMARKAHAAFHAGLPWQAYPVARLTADQFIAWAATREVDLVLVGPIEREYAGAAFDLAGLERLRGVDVVHDDGVNAVYRLDRTVPAADLGTDPALDDARAAYGRAVAGGEPGELLGAARQLALVLRQAGELVEAREVLGRGIAASEVADGTLLAARLDLAWLCLLLGDHAGGQAALQPHLAHFHAHHDRVLEARAHEALGLLLLGQGRAMEAGQYLGSAVAIFGDLGRVDDQRRVRALLRAEVGS